MAKSKKRKTPESPENIDLNNPEFTKAWELLQFTNQSVFLTGKAGTGKSTFLRYITANTKKKYVVLAPTGIAAVNVGGQTLHSFFKLPFHPVLADDKNFDRQRLRERMKYTSAHIRLLRELELIIIDEISMVRADTIDFIDKLLRFYTRNERQPFGGKQLLLVGDVFQLEPVLTQETRDILRTHYNQPYFFNAHAFADIRVIPIELRKVYRQTDDSFVNLLDRIRSGVANPADIALLNSRCVGNYAASQSESQSSFVMTLAARRDTVDYINESRLAALDRPIVEFEGVIKGDFPENSLPTDLELQLKEGAQVVFIKNDPEHRWVNGTLGRVTAIAKDLLEVTLENGQTLSVEKGRWRNVKYVFNPEDKTVDEIELGSFEQYPVKLAWALTVHKSQGLTFNNVVIDMGRGAFAGGQTYVALSRCRSFEGMRLLSTVADRDVFVNPVIVQFSRSFNDPQLIDSALEKAHADNCYVKAAAKANEGKMQEAFDLWIEGMKSFPLLENEGVMRLTRRKLGIVDSQRAEIERLKAELASANDRFTEIASEYVSLGQDCVSDEIYPAAVANFSKALSLLDAESGSLSKSDGKRYSLAEKALTGRAASYKQMEDFALAIVDYDRLRLLNPMNFNIHLELAEIYFKTDDLHNAMNRCLTAEKLLETETIPRHQAARFHTIVADIYEALGDTSAAAHHRKIAKRLRIK